MTALFRFWQNFARWVQRGHAAPLPAAIPIEPWAWAARKAAYALARARHHGQADAYAHLRKATNDALTHELCMRAARETHRDLQTLRETLAFGSGQSGGDNG